MLSVKNIHFSFADKKVLNGISAAFEPCKIHGIIGPNGSGKSTFLKNICRVFHPQQGTVFINQTDYRSISRRHLSRMITLVPQNTVLNFSISVYDIVAMGRNPHLGRFQPLRERDRLIIDTALQETHTHALRDRNIGELSGGESQLCIIARALATEASIILLDEPTSNLDIKHSLAIMDLLVRLKELGKTIVASFHDLNLAKRYCDSISIIRNGTIFFSGSPAEAFSKGNMREVFDVDVAEIQKGPMTVLYFH